MEIGQLNRRIRLQSRSATLDAYGQEVNSWVDIATIWSNVKPIGGKEKAWMANMDSVLTHRVTIRYKAEYMPPTKVDAWRIVYPIKSGDRIFNILAAQDIDEAHKHIVFDCQEGSQTGGA